MKNIGVWKNWPTQSKTKKVDGEAHPASDFAYVPDPEKIEAGVKILAEEIEKAWREGNC